MRLTLRRNRELELEIVALSVSSADDQILLLGVQKCQRIHFIAHKRENIVILRNSRRADDEYMPQEKERQFQISLLARMAKYRVAVNLIKCATVLQNAVTMDNKIQRCSL